jgi:hypothetical protein
MKLCVFYNKPAHVGLNHIEWFVCQACQRKLHDNKRIELLKKAAKELSKSW